jgi:DNA helicase-2/ATP-dependent DNA helicase PcrA
MPFDPTEEQRRLLTHNPHAHGVLLAGPGTGKSATMVAYIEQLANEEEAPRVRLLTFTRAATSELALKVSEHPALTAQRPSTIHSFAISVLMRNPGAANFPQPLRMADDWEQKNIVRPTLARRADVDLRDLDILLRELEANWQSLRPGDDPRIAPSIRARFLGAWDEHRRTYGYTMLSELPNLLRQALENHDDLQGIDYNLLIVDEYQDLNACDLEVLRFIADRGCAILGAGDDDQSIYGFRKAAPEGIRRFPDDYESSESYSLSIAKRCARLIIEWSRFVIEGDPDRPRRPPLTPDEGAPTGEVALLSFPNNDGEAAGIATLVEQLIAEGIPPDQILVLFRGDHNGHFSAPVKEHLMRRGIAVSDSDVVDRALSEERNRRTLALLRLAAGREDSLAWATILYLTPQVGVRFFDYIYGIAVGERVGFGKALLREHETRFEGAPKAPASRAAEAIDAVLAWLDGLGTPDEAPDDGWGHWIGDVEANDVFSGFDEQLLEIVRTIDTLVEPSDLSRFLGQIAPLGKDLAAARSQGVRLMTMGGSKGLTVQATIVAGVEEGIVPRPEAELAEERRLLYVAMTRARRYLFVTWCQRRTGPTARSGAPNVGLRNHSNFVNGGPVQSRNGTTYINARRR